MAQKFFNGSFHGNNNPEKISGFIEDRQTKFKGTYKITQYWESWEVQVKKLKETITRP